VAEELIEKGSNLRIRNDYDRTPLDEAKTPQMRKLLEGLRFFKYLNISDYDPGSKCWVIDN
jgi:hypothetical protein